MQPLFQIKPSRLRKPKRRRKDNLSLLSVEVLCRIVSYLPVPAILALRMTSRSLYVATSESPLITQLWFSPYLEDRQTFAGVCNHPFLGAHVTTLAYDITRFADLSLEKLRELWPRQRSVGRRESRKLWIARHPGPWQYRNVVMEAKASSFDELQELTEGLRKLPKLRTIKLSFAFQQTWLKTEKECMSPLRLYSDIEWVSLSGDHCKIPIDRERMSTLLEAIVQSGVVIEGLDFWQDYISIPLSAFNFQERFDELAAVFSHLKRLTIRIAASSMEHMEATPDMQALRKLVQSANSLEEFHLCIDEMKWEDRLRSWMMDLSRAGFEAVPWNNRPSLLMGGRFDRCRWSPAWPGTVCIVRRK